MGWPQIVIITMGAMTVGVSMAKHGEPRTSKFNFFMTSAVCALEMWILHAGGFFAATTN